MRLDVILELEDDELKSIDQIIRVHLVLESEEHFRMVSFASGTIV